jgi:hypothetical protein
MTNFGSTFICELLFTVHIMYLVTNVSVTESSGKQSLVLNSIFKYCIEKYRKIFLKLKYILLDLTKI